METSGNIGMHQSDYLAGLIFPFPGEPLSFDMISPSIYTLEVQLKASLINTLHSLLRFLVRTLLDRYEQGGALPHSRYRV